MPLIKFTQDDVGGGSPGIAFIGVLFNTVYVENSAGALAYYRMVETPQESLLVDSVESPTFPGGIMNFSPQAAVTFNPDVPGTYQIIISDPTTGRVMDRRDFIVPTPAGLKIPAHGSDASTFNYEGQKKGTSLAVNEILHLASPVYGGLYYEAKTGHPNILSAVYTKLVQWSGAHTSLGAIPYMVDGALKVPAGTYRFSYSLGFSVGGSIGTDGVTFRAFSLDDPSDPLDNEILGSHYIQKPIAASTYYNVNQSFVYRASSEKYISLAVFNSAVFGTTVDLLNGAFTVTRAG
jgi:hypothetical protein